MCVGGVSNQGKKEAKRKGAKWIQSSRGQQCSCKDSPISCCSLRRRRRRRRVVFFFYVQLFLCRTVRLCLCSLIFKLVYWLLKMSEGLRSELEKYLETLNIRTSCVEHPPVKLNPTNKLVLPANDSALRVRTSSIRCIILLFLKQNDVSDMSHDNRERNTTRGYYTITKHGWVPLEYHTFFTFSCLL